MVTMTTKVALEDHGARAHALLSASGASRWFNCTPSAKLEEQFGERKSSAYAEEGTLAHELGELYLTKDTLNAITEEQFNERLEELMSHELFNEEMLEAVPMYTDYCSSQLTEARTANPIATMELEQKLDLTAFVPESFGTADCVIVNDEIMEVIDLKYGKGVPVYADWNKQLMLYGLGALHKYDSMYDIKVLRLTIVQPRINNISTFVIDVDKLLEWAEAELKPAARLAHEGAGELNAGEWCRFCAVKNRCRKLYEKQMEVAKYEFAEAELLSDEEIADVVLRLPKLVEWANSVQDYAQEKAVKGDKQWPGLKLVEGVSRRKWNDEDTAGDSILGRFPELSDDQVFVKKLASISAVEKLVGKKKFETELSDLTIKPQGKPTLVPVDDKRPAMGIQQAQLDFSDNN